MQPATVVASVAILSHTKTESEGSTANAWLHFLPDNASMALWFGPSQPYKSFEFTSSMRWKKKNPSAWAWVNFHLTFVIKICAIFTKTANHEAKTRLIGSYLTQEYSKFLNFYNINFHKCIKYLQQMVNLCVSSVLLQYTVLKHRTHVEMQRFHTKFVFWVALVM